MSSTTHFPDPDSFQRQSDEFMTWLAGRPGVQINPKIRVTDLRSQDAGRGVVAQFDILEGEELFTIPRGLILTPQNSNLNSILRHDLEELFGPWIALILVMIYEYLQGEQSTWAPYFKVLPRNFDTLIFWSASELQELQGSAIVDKIGKEGAEEVILHRVAPMVRENPSLFPPIDGIDSYEGEQGTQAILYLAHLMGSLIMAYAFDIENPDEDESENGEDESGYLTDEEGQFPKGMVPLADLLNADADRNNARLFQENDSLVMKAIKPIMAETEIFNDYGEIPRTDLLRRYGYVTDNYAQFDVVEVSLEQICKAAGLANADIDTQPPLQFLESLELLDDGYTIPRPPPSDSLAEILGDELLVLLKTLTLSPQQLAHQTSKDKPPKPLLDQAAAGILQNTLQLKGAQYATTLSQDADLLAQLNQRQRSGPLDGSSRRQKMAIQVRMGEKEILQNLFTMINNFAAAEGGMGAKRSANGDIDESRNSKTQRTW